MAENLTDYLTDEERMELTEQKDAGIDGLVETLKNTDEPDRLSFYQTKILPALGRLSLSKQAIIIKTVAKLVGIRTVDIRAEIQKLSRSRRETNPVWIDDEGKFVPPPLAEKIMEDEKFLYDRQAVYYYGGGVYKPQGIYHIKKIVMAYLEDKYRDAHGLEVAKYIETATFQDRPILDSNPMILNLENGIIDMSEWVKTGVLSLKKHSPEYKSTIRIPVKYDPAAECPTINKFFRDVLPADCVDLMFQIMGYFMFPDCRQEKAVMFVGEGSNGKSTIIKLITKFVGKKNISNVSLQDLGENRFAKAELAGKLLNMFPDISAKTLDDSAIFKALVSGDEIQVERKGQNPFKLRNTARMVFSANKIPRSKDNTYAFFRRWIIIRFSNQFPENSPNRDENLIDKITTPAELSGLLNLALNGFMRLTDNKRFDSPVSTQAELDAYKLQNDTVKQFIDECCVIKEQCWEDKQPMYDAYKKWCLDAGSHPSSKSEFNSRLKSQYPQVTEDRNNGPRKWRGIAVVDK